MSRLLPLSMSLRLFSHLTAMGSSKQIRSLPQLQVGHSTSLLMRCMHLSSSTFLCGSVDCPMNYVETIKISSSGDDIDDINTKVDNKHSNRKFDQEAKERYEQAKKDLDSMGISVSFEGLSRPSHSQDDKVVVRGGQLGGGGGEIFSGLSAVDDILREMIAEMRESGISDIEFCVELVESVNAICKSFRLMPGLTQFLLIEAVEVALENIASLLAQNTGRGRATNAALQEP